MGPKSALRAAVATSFITYLAPVFYGHGTGLAGYLVIVALTYGEFESSLVVASLVLIPQTISAFCYYLLYRWGKSLGFLIGAGVAFLACSSVLPLQIYLWPLLFGP